MEEVKERQKLGFEDPKNVILEFKGKNLEIKPWLEENEVSILILEYLKVFFDKDNLYNYVEAEQDLKRNVSIFAVPGWLIDSKIFNSTNLFEQITTKIVNYNDFRKTLDAVVSNEKEKIALSNSVGAILNNVSEKLISILDGLSSITPEQITKIKDEGMELLKQIETSSASELFKESQGKSTRKKHKPVVSKNTTDLVQ